MLLSHPPWVMELDERALGFYRGKTELSAKKRAQRLKVSGLAIISSGEFYLQDKE